VIAQSGLALVLLVGSGLLVRSFAELMNTDPGFESEDVLSFQVALPFESYNSPAAMADFHMSMLDEFAGLPGVESVGALQDLPLDETPNGTGFSFDEPTAPEDGLPPIVYYTFASPGYFETMGIAVEEGRSFTRTDHENDFGHVIISRSVAERHWPGEDALRNRPRFAGDTPDWQMVVGVVEDVRDVGPSPRSARCRVPSVRRPKRRRRLVRGLSRLYDPSRQRRIVDARRPGCDSSQGSIAPDLCDADHG